MIGRNWQAYISPESSFFTSRLVIGRYVGDRVEIVNGDGTCSALEAAGAETVGGIVLPTDALDAVAEAIKKVRGDTNHEAEARVLRDWLDSERGRVDDILRVMRGGRP